MTYTAKNLPAWALKQRSRVNAFPALQWMDPECEARALALFRDLDAVMQDMPFQKPERIGLPNDWPVKP